MSNFGKMEAKNFMIGIVLILVTLIFVVRLLPYMWKYIQESPEGVNYTVNDIPGGGILTGLAVFLIVLMVAIALVLKVFDLV